MRVQRPFASTLLVSRSFLVFSVSTIEMSTRGLNFGDGKNLGTLPVTFQQAVDVVS